MKFADGRYKGVTVEANYDVGEYDVSILSANESDGLVNYLTDNGYKIPAGADSVLGSYIKQKMRFFVAKVNIERMQGLNNGYLRPLQVRYDTAKFMLPLRLGTVNSNGPQDLIILALSKNGRIETANYRTVKLPSNIEVPLYVKQEFGPFYRGDVRARGRAREHAGGVRRICLGHGLVRSLRGRPVDQQGTGRARRTLDRERRRTCLIVRVRAPMPT